MNNTTIEIGVAVLIASVFAVILTASFFYGTGKSEIVECTKWSQEADAYPGFYLAKWQANQCAAHQIIINAPVK